MVCMEKICSCPDCASPVYRRTYCNAHYMRFKRYGSPLIQKRKSPGTVTDADRKEWRRKEYENNRTKYIERNARRRYEQADKVKAEKRKYLDRDEVKKAARIRTMEWKEKNPERKKQSDKEWRVKNVDKKRSYQAFRRAKVREATPPWLTKEHRKQIALIYREALRLSGETGVLHHVDHIVPLAGREVSGLHVPWNLRAIPAAENHKKSNKLVLT